MAALTLSPPSISKFCLYVTAIPSSQRGVKDVMIWKKRGMSYRREMVLVPSLTLRVSSGIFSPECFCHLQQQSLLASH